MNLDRLRRGVMSAQEAAKVADEIERLWEIVAESPEKWGFDTLMWAADRLLAETYPADIFTGISGDPGPRLVVALRDCRAVVKARP